ncbi:MAG: hypothetical protein MRJ65_05455 [Candidatus Brocadiaceae bacterium]|nr:hypothetical protein [Candidatus Brocadiaceae bacterium]
MKRIYYKVVFPLFFSFLVIGCSSSERSYVKLSSTLDKRIYQKTPLSLAVGIYLDPSLRSYVQEETVIHYNVGYHRYYFPVGEHLTDKIEEAARTIFQKTILLENLPGKEDLKKLMLDGIVVIRLKDSKMEFTIDESVFYATGLHKLSITVSYLDAILVKKWESEITVEGKGLDSISSMFEYEIWGEWGPDFTPAIEDAIQKVTYELVQKIIEMAETTQE